MGDWERKLSEWVDAGLVSSAQAAKIRSLESAGTAPVEPAGASQRAVSPAVEAVGYLGGALAGAALVFFLQAFVPNLTGGAKVALALLLTIVIGAGGSAVKPVSPPAARLKSVLWTVTVAGAAATGALVASELSDASDEAVAFTAFGAAFVTAAVLWFRYRSGLLNAVVLGTVLAASVSLIVWVGIDLDTFFVGLLVWALSAGWALLAWAGLLPPDRTGQVVGAVGALVGAQIAAAGSYRTWGLVLGVLTVVVVLVAGARENQLGLMIVGAIGALVFAVQVVGEVFGSDLAAAVALLVAGALLVLGAVVAAKRRAERGPP